VPPGRRYTYENAGFNGFMTRSLKSNPGAQTLAGNPSGGARAAINFDMLQSSGAITDSMRIGSKLELQGNNGRLVVKDDSGNEVGWVGDLDT
jgi:hypothetical protein